MKKIYKKLASTLLRRYKESYIPFVLTCIGIILIHYIVYALGSSQNLAGFSGMSTMREILGLGEKIILFFSVAFMLYTNSFLMKRRKKEFAIYHILGMEKKHLVAILAWENFYIAAVGILGGIASGVLLYRLVEGIFLRIIGREGNPNFLPDITAILYITKVYVVLFLFLFLWNSLQILLAKPMELLHAQKAGERLPKSNIFLAFAGLVCLVAGYWISLGIQTPIQALQKFFIAVLLVIVGTYICFIELSVVLLKFLQKRKSIYYRLNFFTGISGLIFRMKQNAAGLASICILSTMVLVLASSAFSFYAGGDAIIRHRYPRNFMISADGEVESQNQKLIEMVEAKLDEQEILIQNAISYRYTSYIGRKKTEGSRLSFETADQKNLLALSEEDVLQLIIVPYEDVREELSNPTELAEDEAYVLAPKKDIRADSIELSGNEYKIKEKLSDGGAFIQDDVVRSIYIILPNMGKVAEFQAQMKEELNGQGDTALKYLMAFDTEIPREQQLKLHRELNDDLAGIRDIYVESAEHERKDFTQIYGAIFFCGIVLGTVFMLAVILNIYYKQLVEGFEDKERFHIMQKLGMTDKEVYSSIRSQILIVFFLPLIFAGMHLAFAFPMIKSLLTLLNMNDAALFIRISFSTFVVFALMYTGIYLSTARVYHRMIRL